MFFPNCTRNHTITYTNLISQSHGISYRNRNSFNHNFHSWAMELKYIICAKQNGGCKNIILTISKILSQMNGWARAIFDRPHARPSHDTARLYGVASPIGSEISPFSEM